MRQADRIRDKIFSFEGMITRAKQLRIVEKKIAFTNGVFDILHPGHIHTLSEAAKTADFLFVGINSDASVKRLKGDQRPLYNQDTRALMLASLAIVDVVAIFEQDTPLELIEGLRPDVLVKGGDYTIDQVAGAKEVISYGGQVIINPLLEGFSTTALIRQIQKT